MKKIYNIFAVVLFAGLFIAGCASPPAVGSNDTVNPLFTIVNNTGYEVWYVFMSPVTDENWGDDWLAPDQVLSDGQSVTLELQYPLNVHSMYDIMLEDLDGDTYSKYEVTVTANGRIVFTFDDFDYGEY